MYDCGITAKAFIATVREEADISAVIPEASWLRWINTVEQFLYTEILQEYSKKEMPYTEDVVPLETIGENVTFDDVVRVYGDEVELDRAGVISGMVFPDKPMYWADYEGNLHLNPTFPPYMLTVVHRLRPALKTGSENINIPVEWLDMLAARMRGEAYKIANEDGLAGKWLQDYNMQLESFKVWAAKRNERYGE